MPEKPHDSFISKESDDRSPLLRVTEASLRALEHTAIAGLSLQHKLDEEKQASERLMHDDVAPSFLNRRGAMELIETDAELAEELREGACGIIFLDVRFLKYINDTFSDEYGDTFLSLAAQKINEILDARIRTIPAGSSDNERKPDVRIRYGGDEFIILVRRVTPNQLEAVAERLRSEFSVTRAIEESKKQGRMPIAANTVTCHANELPSDERTRMKGKEVFMNLRERLHDSHIQAKKAQYDEMWQRIKAVTELRDNDRPSEERAVAGMFLRFCCSSYMDQLTKEQ